LNFTIFWVRFQDRIRTDEINFALFRIETPFKEAMMSSPRAISNRLCCLVIVAVSTLSSQPSSFAAIAGNVDGSPDGQVTLADAVVALRCCAGVTVVDIDS
jgi:hypothetical protein